MSFVSVIPKCLNLAKEHVKLKVKGKVVPVLFLTEHHAVKWYWGSGGIAQRILLARH